MKNRLLISVTVILAFAIVQLVLGFSGYSPGALIAEKLYHVDSVNPALHLKAFQTSLFLNILLSFILGGFLFWAVFRWMGASLRQDKKLLLHGESATAVILSVEDMGITLNKINPVVRLTLKVSPTHGSPFEVTLEKVVSRIAIPRVGDTVSVKYDARDSKKVAVL